MTTSSPVHRSPFTIHRSPPFCSLLTAHSSPSSTPPSGVGLAGRQTRRCSSGRPAHSGPSPARPKVPPRGERWAEPCTAPPNLAVASPGLPSRCPARHRPEVDCSDRPAQHPIRAGPPTPPASIASVPPATAAPAPPGPSRGYRSRSNGPFSPQCSRMNHHR